MERVSVGEILRSNRTAYECFQCLQGLQENKRNYVEICNFETLTIINK